MHFQGEGPRGGFHAERLGGDGYITLSVLPSFIRETGRNAPEKGNGNDSAPSGFARVRQLKRPGFVVFGKEPSLAFKGFKVPSVAIR